MEKVIIVTMPAVMLMMATADWLVLIILGPQWASAKDIRLHRHCRIVSTRGGDRRMVAREPGARARHAALVVDKRADFDFVDPCRCAVGCGWCCGFVFAGTNFVAIPCCFGLSGVQVRCG